MDGECSCAAIIAHYEFVLPATDNAEREAGSRSRELHIYTQTRVVSLSLCPLVMAFVENMREIAHTLLTTI